MFDFWLGLVNRVFCTQVCSITEENIRKPGHCKSIRDRSYLRKMACILSYQETGGPRELICMWNDIIQGEPLCSIGIRNVSKLDTLGKGANHFSNIVSEYGAAAVNPLPSRTSPLWKKRLSGMCGCMYDSVPVTVRPIVWTMYISGGGKSSLYFSSRVHCKYLKIIACEKMSIRGVQ